MLENKNPDSKELLTQDMLKHSWVDYHQHWTRYIWPIVLISLAGGFFGGLISLYGIKHNRFLNEYFLASNSVLSKEPQNRTVVLAEDSSVIDVVKQASPAVVSIVVTKDISKLRQFGFNPFEDDFFDLFGSTQKPKSNVPDIRQVGAGSGFFVSADGLILTNKHVVADSQASYTVITNDGKEYEAKILTTDSRNDLAIIKIEIAKSNFLEFAPADNLTVGQRVIAIGNSLGQYQNTVTTGVISGIGRSIIAGSSEGTEQLEGVIQTDAAINPGNSGGPLLNSLGQVVGINTAVDNQGQLVGFAIPGQDAKKALESYKKSGKISRPFIGVRYIMLSKALAEKEQLPKDYGALLIRGDSTTDFAVVPGSPADKAGLKENDIILEINGVELKKEKTLAQELKKYDVNAVLNLKIYSGGNERIVRVTLVEGK